MGVSLVSCRWGRFEEVELFRDVVLGDSGSVGRRWLQMRWSSATVGPQGALGIGGEGRRRGVVRYLAFRSRCPAVLCSGGIASVPRITPRMGFE